MTLYDYQREGVDWLKKKVRGRQGCILADGCGLGKTIMTIFLLRELYEHNKKKYFPSLICVPSSVLIKWGRELTQFGFQGSVSLHHGSKRLQTSSYSDVMVTTYATFCRDTLHSIPWKVVVLDEGAALKNNKTARYKAFMKLRTRRRVVLSATPLQNHPMEIYSLFAFLQPTLLGTEMLFREYFSDPITRAIRCRGSMQFLRHGVIRAKLLSEKISPYILRRTNQLKIPGKVERTLLVIMGPEQLALYRRIRRENRQVDNGYERDRRLLSVCNGTHLDCEKITISKLKVLKEIVVQFLTQDHKVSIFMKYKATVSKVCQVLKAWSPLLVITGETPPKARQDYIDLFEKNKKYKIIIMTTRTGGFGINLLKATRSILLSPDYNPAVDNQASERANRKGQTKTVGVYRIITEGTVEERIYNRQLDKMCGNNLLVSEGSSTGKPTKRDSFDLLKSSLFQVVDHDKLKDAVLNDFVLSSHKKMYLSLKQVDDASESRKRKIEKKWKRGLQKFEKKLTVVLTKGPQSSTDLLTRFKPLIKKYGLLAQAIRAVLRKKASLNKKELRWHLKGSL